MSEALGGGVQTAVVNYTEVLPNYHHVVFARSRNGHSTKLWPEHVETHEVKSGLARFYAETLRIIRAIDPDVIHLHSTYAGLVRLSLSCKAPIVYSPHCFAMERENDPWHRRKLYRALEQILAKRTQAVVAVSPREAELARELSKSVSVHVVPNFTTMETGSHTLGNISDRKTVAMLGRISAQKDPLFFNEVASSLRGTLRFVWIGDGDEDVKAKLRQSGVRVTGWISPKEVMNELSAADLYLHTAAWEGAPLSPLEAAAAGCAVLARTIPSMKSIGYSEAGFSAQEVSVSVLKFFYDESFRSRTINETAAVISICNQSAAKAALERAYDSVIGVANTCDGECPC